MNSISVKPWIGVDLDGTLAHYDHWRDETHIGPIIEPMRLRVLKWLDEGRTVKIFTARVCSLTGEDLTVVAGAIWKWCEANGLPKLDITNVKDFQMIELWDDRAVQVIPNTGRTIHEATESELQALRGKP
jgi:hypothetical protein